MKAIVSLTKYGLIHFWKIEIARENIFISFYLNDDTYISYNAYNLQLVNKQILMNFLYTKLCIKIWTLYSHKYINILQCVFILGIICVHICTMIINMYDTQR